MGVLERDEWRSEHGIHVDYKGYVCDGTIAWAAPWAQALADDQVLKFTGDGTFVKQTEQQSKQGNCDTRNVRQAADVFVY